MAQSDNTGKQSVLVYIYDMSKGMAQALSLPLLGKYVYTAIQIPFFFRIPEASHSFKTLIVYYCWPARYQYPQLLEYQQPTEDKIHSFIHSLPPLLLVVSTFAFFLLTYLWFDVQISNELSLTKLIKIKYC